MKLALISQQCDAFKIEYGVLGASWTEWTFLTVFSENQVNSAMKYIPAGNIVKVYGHDMLNNYWIKIMHNPMLKRVK